MSIFGPVPAMRTMRFRAKSLKKYENTWFAACPSRIAKNVPTVFVFYCKNVLEHVEVGLRSPKTRPLKPHLSSGNAENEPRHLPLNTNFQMSFAWKPQKNVSTHAGLRKYRRIISDGPKSIFLGHAGFGKFRKIFWEASK